MFLFDIIIFLFIGFCLLWKQVSCDIPFHSLNDVISNWLNLPSSTLHRPLAGRGSDRIFVINLVPELQNNGENWSAMYIYTWVHIRAYVHIYIYTTTYICIFIYTDGLNICSIYSEYTTCAYLIIYIYYIVYVLCVGSIFQEKSLDCESDPFDSLSKELHDQVENDGQTRWNLVPPRWWLSFPARFWQKSTRRRVHSKMPASNS